MNRTDALMLCLDRVFFLFALSIGLLNAINPRHLPTGFLLWAFAPMACTSMYLIRRTLYLSRR